MITMKKFGTFGGVFTPTLLTILGVIMYLRLGWVVGNAGLLGAWLIICISFAITIATALSMSSITTNNRIGAGGAYAIISQALGLEVGGSLGIPRFISQGLAVTMYIFGFREGWLMIFPTHDPFLIDLCTFVVLFVIAYISADLAIKTQYVIMAVIFASLVTIVLAGYFGSMKVPAEDAVRWGGFEGVEESGNDAFWVVFAVFFPAATGIMAGANMSGELKDPRKSIPSGTLWAIGVSFVIYMALAFWISRSATEHELLTNNNVMIDKSFFPPLMIAGVLGATFSSALASIIGSSRILFAMGEHGVVPQSKWTAVQNKTGQPRNAMIVTGILIFLSMLLRDLNAVAPLVTMFFLITYAMLNVVVIIEQNLGLVSFRPLFTVNRFIPWIGLIGSVTTMFIINSTLSLVSWVLMVLAYSVLSRRKMKSDFEDVRSGLFTSFSEWAARHTAEIGHQQERAWKPNLLVPVKDTAILRGAFSILEDIASPKGSIVLLGLGSEKNAKYLKEDLDPISKRFIEKSLFSSYAIMKTEGFAEGVNFSNQAFTSSFFRPNIVFLNLAEEESAIQDFMPIIQESQRLELGAILFAPHAKAMLGQRQTINVWLRDRSPGWEVWDGKRNPNLAILVAYKLKMNWQGSIRLITVCRQAEEMEAAHKFLVRLAEEARLPVDDFAVMNGEFQNIGLSRVKADINIFGLSPQLDVHDYLAQAQRFDSTCLFIMDSGHENAFA